MVTKHRTKNTSAPQPDGAIMHNDALFGALYKHMPIPITLWHHQEGDFVFLDCNDSAVAYSGASILQRKGGNASFFYQDLPDVLACFYRCIDEQKPVNHQITYMLPGRGTTHLDLTFTFIDPDLVMMHFIDITARYEAESALKESESRHRLMVDALQEGICLYDSDGTMIDCNPSAAEILDIPRDDIIGHKPEDKRVRTIHEDGTPFLIEDFPLPYVLKTGKPQTNVVMGVTRTSGDQSWILINANPLFHGEDHTLDSVFISFHDITERKKAEEEHLAKEKAETASRAKSTFLSRMSHELRTPLNAMLGFAQLLQMDLSRPDHVEMLDQMLKAGRHLLDLINDVLDISRVEEGRLAIASEPVQLEKLLRDSIELMRPLAAAREVKLNVEGLDNEDLCIRGDNRRLRQVFMNLIDNAIKYNKKDGTVTVRCERRNSANNGAAGERLRILVSDTGAGIAPDKVDRLFVPFDRLGAESSNVEGTGLGLVTSKLLVEAMGGEIGFCNVPDAATTFWVEFPLLDDAQNAQHMTSAPAPPKPAPRKRRCVLYIEDNDANIKLVKMIFSRRQEVLLLATDGAQGVRFAKEHNPDLVLLDLQLPDMNGEEVLAQLRADPKLKKTTVIIVSADGSPERIESLLSAGIHSYVTKPLEVREFIAMLDTLAAAEALTI